MLIRTGGCNELDPAYGAGRRFRPSFEVWGEHSIARVSVIGVKDIRVVGMGDCGMRRPRPTQAGDEPPRYIFLPLRGLRFFEWGYQQGAMVGGAATPLPLDSGLRRNDRLRGGLPAFPPGGVAIGVRSRGDSAWILAFARMTKWGPGMTRRAGAGLAGTQSYCGVLWDDRSEAGDKPPRYI